MKAVKTIKTKKLVSTFNKSNGKKQNLIIQNPTVDKSAAEIREALELLTTLDIFEEEDGVKTFSEVDTCKYIETTKYIQFDPKNPIEAEEIPETPSDVPTPASCLSPIKPINYGKFVDLVCPPALENLSETTIVPEIRTSEQHPTFDSDDSSKISEKTNELPIENQHPIKEPTNSENSAASSAPHEENTPKPRRRRRLLDKLRNIRNST